MISAFLDDEGFDPAHLAAALAAPGGRDLLLDLVALRHLVQDETASDQPAAAAVRPRMPAARWFALAAGVCLVVGSSYWLGRRSSPADRPVTAPQPTQVIELQEGVNWHVAPADRSNGGR
ncbi:MAG TPA: hypothetical protein VJN96_07960 [Vicinamibacterales bacterium]|nr:hypothetical protein [Vicinamibacterales bacterium]